MDTKNGQALSFRNRFIAAWNSFLNKDYQLMRQFFTTLEAIYNKNRVCTENPSQAGEESKRGINQELFREIEERLSGEQTWENAYKIEQLLIPVYSDNDLDIELKRRLREVPTQLSKELQDFYRDEKKVIEGKNRDEKNSLLSRLVNDLQWKYFIRETHRKLERSITCKICLIFCFAMAFFFLNTIFSSSSINLTGTKHYYLFNAIASGLLGASFSMLIGLRKRLEESTMEVLKSTSGFFFLISRVLIGLGAGLLMFYLINGDLLAQAMSSTLVPNLDFCLETDTKCIRNVTSFDPEFAKLVIICFLAGFSEKLVPNILSRTEGENANSGAKPPANQQS